MHFIKQEMRGKRNFTVKMRNLNEMDINILCLCPSIVVEFSTWSCLLHLFSWACSVLLITNFGCLGTWLFTVSSGS